MNPPIITQIAFADPRATPITINETIALLNTLLHSEIVGSYIPYVISTVAPGVDDRDKAWIQLDAQSRAIAIKTWVSGSWRRIYNGMPNEIRMYTGNPNVDFNGTGMGIIGGNYDGWHLCNGNDGAVDLSDNFIIAAHMNNADHAGWTAEDGWVTWISDAEGQHTGGVRDITLDATNTYDPPRAAIDTALWSADGNAPTSGGDLWGQGSANPKTIVEAYAGNPTPPAISTIPPFIAMGYIQFLGYIDIS